MNDIIYFATLSDSTNLLSKLSTTVAKYYIKKQRSHIVESIQFVSKVMADNHLLTLRQNTMDKQPLTSLARVYSSVDLQHGSKRLYWDIWTPQCRGPSLCVGLCRFSSWAWSSAQCGTPTLHQRVSYSFYHYSSTRQISISPWEIMSLHLQANTTNIYNTIQ